MLLHTSLGDTYFARMRKLHRLITSGEVALGGYAKTKIFGMLDCRSGKRMKPENRIFFTNEQEAIGTGYRPCAHCMPATYNKWKMDLFNTEPTANLLPFDGEVNYYGQIMPVAEANTYLQVLLDTIDWKNDEAVIFGKHLITKRKVAWYADANFAYTYSNTTKQALTWTNELLALKAMVEKLTGTNFNSCLLNLYHTGDEGMGWHSDDEKALGKDTAIASLSFGAERKFMLKHRATKHPISLMLANGSLLVMKGSTQTNWLHALPKTKKVTTPRVNLTFRTMIPQQ